jgi:exosortase
MKELPNHAWGGRWASSGVLWVPWLLLLLYWIQFWNRLRVDWSTEAEYTFGWFVPFLAIGLLYFRWESRPAPGPPKGLPSKMLTASIILVFLLHIPISLVEEANAGWRALLWFREFWLMGLSLALIGLVGGWSWVRHFAFPLCFTATAVPWPSAWESVLTQTLMRGSAAIALDVLNIAGFPAVRHGNLIEVATGVVGVEEACSGVRGLQTSLMVSLVLGELVRFSFPRRLFLVLAGAMVALLLNLLRAIVLSWLAASQGLGGVDKWHHTAGILEFGGILAAMALVYWLLRSRSVRALHNLDQVETRAGFQPISLSVSLIALLVLFGGVATTAAWYGLHESSFLPNTRWTIERPTEFSENFPNFESHPIPDRTRELLRAPEGWSYSWSEPEGLEFRVFF